MCRIDHRLMFGLAIGASTGRLANLAALWSSGEAMFTKIAAFVFLRRVSA
ncbi:hypothetical protein RISK_005201 [Rhodopirellula islandica]|uniref:Uncharacterized protein n=1 Tax=Rhodopirellula islandica TaxID=595434 RepID=A0A0J1B7X6_RHOIS|nr:hypothetical protein RISK_005201 [Rhodopirellula islandica]